jgi:hypothetical protein
MTDFNAAFRTQAMGSDLAMQRRGMDQQLQMQDRQVAASLPSLAMAFRQQRLAERQSQFQEEQALFDMQDRQSRRAFEERAFERRSAFEDEQLVMARQQQAFSQRQGAADMEIKRTVAEAQIADYEMQTQLNNQRLMQMQALDQAELSRLQIEQQRLATESARFQLDTAKQQMEQQRKDMESGGRFDLERQKLESDVFANDPTFIMDQETRRYRAATEAERKQREKDIRSKRTAYQDRSGGSADYPFSNQFQKLAANAQGYDATIGEGGGWVYAPISPEEKKAAQAQMAEMQARNAEEMAADLRSQRLNASLRQTESLLREQANIASMMKAAPSDAIMDQLEQRSSKLTEAIQKSREVTASLMEDGATIRDNESGTTEDDILRQIFEDDPEIMGIDPRKGGQK